MSGRVLVVDDERATAENFVEILGDLGYTATAAASEAEALVHLRTGDWFLLVTDLRLSADRDDGLLLIRAAKALQPGLAVIVITAYGSITGAVDAMKLGIDDYLTKPVDFTQFRLLVRGLAERCALRRENEELRRALTAATPAGSADGPVLPLAETVAENERAAIARALLACNGHRGRAARLLKISLRQLHYKINRYSL